MNYIQLAHWNCPNSYETYGSSQISFYTSTYPIYNKIIGTLFSVVPSMEFPLFTSDDFDFKPSI